MGIPIKDIIAKYVELRDRKAEKAKQHAEELAPLSEAMGGIENYFMHVMNEMGVDQLKDKDAGTVFKSTATSCQMQDALAFKQFIFRPAADGIVNYLRSSGYELRDIDHEALANIIRDLPKWDMVDFRAGKKGITEYIANENQPVPGVAVNTVATVSVRRA